MQHCTTQAPEPLYTKEQAATYLGVSAVTIARYMQKGLINYSKFGKSVRFSKADLDNSLIKPSTPKLV